MPELTDLLVDARDNEEKQLQIVLSLKRTRELEERERELRSNSPAGSAPLTEIDENSSKRRKKAKTVMHRTYNTCIKLFPEYMKLPFRTKMLLFITMNSVINLSWDYIALVQVSSRRWKKYLDENKNKGITLPEVVGGDVIAQHFKEQTDRTSKESFIDYSVNLLPSYTTDEQLRMIRIYGHLLSMHAFKQNDLNRWRRMSEQDLFHSIWSTIISIIFENSTVVLTSGETQNAASAELASLHNNTERGAFKIDLRAVLESINNTENCNIIKSYDLSNCEVAKEGKIAKKNVTDNAKLIVEGKVILDKIAQTCQMEFEDAKKLQVINIQISGLKAVLVQVSYAADGQGYVSQTLGKTINFPIAQKSISNFIQQSLPQLLLWKEMAEKNLRILQDGLNQDRGNFGENSDLSYIKPTWLGPKTGSKNNSSLPPAPELKF